MKNHEQSHLKKDTYSVSDFIPLILITVIIIAFTVIRQLMYGIDLEQAMYDFMASFFIIFATFKIINLQGFAEAYSMYDIVTQQIRAYGYIYPFLELGLGLAYLTRNHLMIANWVTLILMTISSIGVAKELWLNRPITCACLGVVFKLPMTYVTLLEDVIMILMSLFLIF